jgi:hypothetical protein
LHSSMARIHIHCDLPDGSRVSADKERAVGRIGSGTTFAETDHVTRSIFRASQNTVRPETD